MFLIMKATRSASRSKLIMSCSSSGDLCSAPLLLTRSWMHLSCSFAFLYNWIWTRMSSLDRAEFSTSLRFLCMDDSVIMNCFEIRSL